MPYNALIVPTFGGCRKVELDFNNYEEMGNAIYASLIKIIITPLTIKAIFVLFLTFFKI